MRRPSVNQAPVAALQPRSSMGTPPGGHQADKPLGGSRLSAATRDATSVTCADGASPRQGRSRVRMRATRRRVGSAQAPHTVVWQLRDGRAGVCACCCSETSMEAVDEEHHSRRVLAAMSADAATAARVEDAARKAVKAATAATSPATSGPYKGLDPEARRRGGAALGRCAWPACGWRGWRGM